MHEKQQQTKVGKTKEKFNTNYDYKSRPLGVPSALLAFADLERSFAVGKLFNRIVVDGSGKGRPGAGVLIFTLAAK